MSASTATIHSVHCVTTFQHFQFSCSNCEGPALLWLICTYWRCCKYSPL